MIVAGTGHRPKSLPCKYNEKHPFFLRLVKALDARIKKTKPSVIVAGGAIGFDTWLAEAALRNKIKLHVYLPFPEQGNTWPQHQQDRQKSILDKATRVVMCSDAYDKSCFFKRDRMMIDIASDVWALLCPWSEGGGTFYTYQYAQNKKLPIHNFWHEVEQNTNA
jgi:uncharacterized phage-like protein YoqJ